jgi:predicted metalloprotease
MKGGARYWDVNFSKRNKTVSMAAEQLANAVNYAHRMGHHILPVKG